MKFQSVTVEVKSIKSKYFPMVLFIIALLLTPKAKQHFVLIQDYKLNVYV